MIGTIISVLLVYLPVKPAPIATASFLLDLISPQSANSVWIITDFSDTTPPGHFPISNPPARESPDNYGSSCAPGGASLTADPGQKGLPIDD